MAARPRKAAKASEFTIRRVRLADIPHVVVLDDRVTGLAKPAYWESAFKRYGQQSLRERQFLIAEPDARSDRVAILGFIIGEVRAWEFGSAPCGWVLALSVEPKARQRGVGHALFAAMENEFKRAGVNQMRTMVVRDNRLHHLFFRAEGMMAGPYIQLEKDLD